MGSLYKIKRIENTNYPNLNKNTIKDVINHIEKYGMAGNAIRKIKLNDSIVTDRLRNKTKEYRAILRSYWQDKTSYLKVTRQVFNKEYSYTISLRDHSSYSDAIKYALNSIKKDIKQTRTENRNYRIRSKQRYMNNEYYDIQYHAGVHIRPGVIFELLGVKKAKMVFTHKQPTDNKNYVGAELEFFSKSGRTILGKKLFDAGLQNNVCLKQDGSIRPDDGMSAHEITILAEQSEIYSIVSRVCEVINADGAKVNKSCGFHVHIDARNRNREVVFSNLVSSQRFLYAMNPKSRAENTFCKMTKSKSMTGVSGRYWGINPESYRRHQTVEVRIHSGTTDPVKVNNWIKILLTIANRQDAVKRSATTMNGFFKQFPMDIDLMQYMIDRTAKFNGSTSTIEDTDENGNEVAA